MHIDSIRLFRVPLAGVTSEWDGAYESILVEMHGGEQAGFGEVTLAAAPVASEEWSAGAFGCLRDWLAPAIVGRTIDSGDALQLALDGFQGNRRAKSALDIAWWSLEANVRKTPLHKLLRPSRDAIPLSATLGVLASTDELFTRIGEALAAGYDHVMLKVRPGWDVEMLRAVRQAFPEAPLAIDCDGLSSLGQQEMFYRIEDFFLKYIEQPLPADDLVGHAMLAENLRTPIGLDQSVVSLARVEQAIDLGSCARVRIGLARVGGITPALAIRKACELAKVPCAVGGGPHGPIADLAAAAVASLCDAPLACEACSSRKEAWVAADTILVQEKNAAGKLEIRLPGDDRGQRLQVDAALLADAAVEQATPG